MINYFTDDKIIYQICKQRIKLAEKRSDAQYLTRLIGRRNPSAYADDLDQLLPPRRLWNAFRPRRRPENGTTDLLALRNAVRYMREHQPAQPWVTRLNQTIAEIQGRVVGSETFLFSKPRISWLQKKGDEYRALCIFHLQDNVIAALLAQYLRDQFDQGFSNSSYAFRSRNSLGPTPTHHDAFNALFELKRARPNQDFYVAECDIRGFFDTVDHEVALAAFERFAQRFPLHPRACGIFRAYLDSYNFQANVLEEAEPLLKQQEGAAAHFPWPRAQLANVDWRVLGVPQGGAVSGIIANLILDTADKAIEREQRRLGAQIHYFRYCDDMILLSPVHRHCQATFRAYLEALDGLKLPYHLLRRTKTGGGPKNDLQIQRAGRKSRKPPTPFVGYKPNGKSQIIFKP